MNATRHSPSKAIASLPFSNRFEGENSVFSPPFEPKNRLSLSNPNQSTIDFRNWSCWAKRGSLASRDLPDLSYQFAPE